MAHKSIEVFLPDELEPFAPNLRYFMETMVRKLHANRHKGFGGAKFHEILPGLMAEVRELEDAIHTESQFNVQLEAADVANFAFLIALRAYQIDKATFVAEQRPASTRKGVENMFREDIIMKATNVPNEIVAMKGDFDGNS